ncbi:PASTA domain-containing protein [Microbacterium hominis]|uniref:protein kinase domain-containing protein n=1 Tax=Microbacterium TaxID=33882 RepID=UPI00168AE2BE|nr:MULTISPECIES: PASTA domain-containing protein [Microbacterium]QOC24678.1 PASTA domain-containing protein [Microbacterium hominis]QOC28738.1 PASTA domain-containing protein [Microbacterium hominis]QYF99022.1 PASTA domain-containing protein [Microbacterium sp. PAMC21962]
MSDGLIADRFHLRRLLGSGGTASVFEADDVVGGVVVALKLLHPHLAVGPAVWEAFFEEVRAARAIAHPNLAEVYDAGVDDRDPPVAWIAMERVDGETLADHVREHGPLEPWAAVALMGAVLDALQAVHDGGVVHRDLTPANIMLDPRLSADAGNADAFARSVRLLDFGLADIPGRTTLGADALLSADDSRTAGVVASVPYASPEQLSGAAVGEASDLYQAGATLCFALTGSAPFAGDARAVVRAHLTAPPPVPSARRRGIPRPLDRVVTTAMLKRPDDRYADAAAMAAALAAAVPAIGVTADTPPDEAGEQTARTRVYRTRLAGDPVTPAAAAGSAPPPAVTAARGAWRAPLVAAVLIAAVTAAAGLSAMAASTSAPPAASPTAPSATASPSVAAPPTPTSVAVVLVGVPQVGGLGLAEATAALESAGLAVGDLARVDGPAPADVVLESSPGAGERVREGSPVTLRLASGSNAIPAVVGMTLADAQAALVSAGFASRTAVVGAGPSGAVSASMPSAGERAPVGTVVVLSIPGETVATPTPSASPTPVPTPSPAVTEPPRP